MPYRSPDVPYGRGTGLVAQALDGGDVAGCLLPELLVVHPARARHVLCLREPVWAVLLVCIVGTGPAARPLDSMGRLADPRRSVRADARCFGWAIRVLLRATTVVARPAHRACGRGRRFTKGEPNQDLHLTATAVNVKYSACHQIMALAVGGSLGEPVDWPVKEDHRGAHSRPRHHSAH